MNSLESFRSELNFVDEQIISLLSRRYEICRLVGHYKREHNIPMMQPARVEEVKDRCANIAARYSIDPDFIRQLYSMIINEACRLEDEIIERAH